MRSQAALALCMLGVRWAIVAEQAALYVTILPPSLSLQSDGFTWVHLDHRHMGVGGDDSWSPTGG